MGAALIILSSSGIGFSYSARLGRRMEQLRQLQRMAILLRGEISYGNAPLPEALASIGRKLDEPLSVFLRKVASRLREYPDKSFQQVFRDEVGDCLKQSALSVKDKDMLMQMGAFLGYLDREMQLRTVELYLQELCREIQVSGESVPGRQKLFRSLGILGGLFLVILLM